MHEGVLVLLAESDAAIRAVVEYHRARLLCRVCIGTTFYLGRETIRSTSAAGTEIVAVGPPALVKSSSLQQPP
jgi:hypothetical protein